MRPVLTSCLVLLFVVAPGNSARTAVIPCELLLNITQDQVQREKLHAVRSDGRRDRSIQRVRVLNLGARLVGPGSVERADFEWFFIGKEPGDGIFDYYSVGHKTVMIPRVGSLKLEMVSEPLLQEKFVEQEFLTSTLHS